MLIAPNHAIIQPDAQRQARLLAELQLFCITVALLLAFLVPDPPPAIEPSGPDVLFLIDIVGLIGLLILYVFLRRGQLNIAVGGTVTLLGGLVLLADLLYSPTGSDLTIYLVVPIIIATIFFHNRALYFYLLSYGVLVIIGNAMLHPQTFLNSFEVQGLPIIMVLVSLAQIHRNRTERDRRAALTAREAQLRAITNTVSDIITQTDANLKIQFVSPSFTRITGWPAERLSDPNGPSTWDLIHPDDRRQFAAMLHSALAQQQPTNLTYRFRRADGEYIWFETLFTITLDNRGQIDEVTFSTRDISDRKQVEAMQELDRMKDEFLSTVAHELRGPLATIHGYAEVLNLIGYEPERSNAYIERIHSQSLHLCRMIEDLLDIERLKVRGGLDLRQDTLHLSAVVDDEVRVFIEQNDDHQFVVDHAPDLPPLTADSQRIAQVVRNLLSNAVKYSPAGTTVTVSSRQIDGRVELSVRDQGPGLGAEDQARLFEAFYRSSTHQHINGTGLGLKVCRTIAELHGGGMRLESAEGAGSCFTLWLPIRAGES